MFIILKPIGCYPTQNETSGFSSRIQRVRIRTSRQRAHRGNRESIMKARILYITLLVGIAIPFIYAQSDTGRITGTVSDSTGAVVQGAAVTVKNEKTGQIRKATANDQVVYLFTQFGAAPYTITTDVTGMAPTEYTGVTLQ